MQEKQSNMYDKLLQLPLFQGMSEHDWSYVVGHTRFEFERTNTGITIIHEGDRCTNLRILIKGELLGESIADDHSYKVIETYHAPLILQPENLFGLTQRYSQNFTTATSCEFLKLSKEDTAEWAEEIKKVIDTLRNVDMYLTNALYVDPCIKCSEQTIEIEKAKEQLKKLIY